jgi:hypothetical protein
MFLENVTKKPRSLLRVNEFFAPATGKRSIQVAFVLDGTSSMREEIDPEFGDRIRAKTGCSEVQVSVVVYRDDADHSDAVTFPVRWFTSDPQELIEGLKDLRAASGVPDTEEMVDAGIYAALRDLNWSPRVEPGRERWIVLCGDAPPYAERTPDEDAGGNPRQHSTHSLIQSARAKGVKIYTLLTIPGDRERSDDYVRKREKAKEFMIDLAIGTGGKFLDMSDRKCVDYWNAYEARIAPIRQEHIDQARRSDRGVVYSTGLIIRLVSSAFDDLEAAEIDEVLRLFDGAASIQVVRGTKAAAGLSGDDPPEFLLDVRRKSLFGRSTFQILLSGAQGRLACRRFTTGGEAPFDLRDALPEAMERLLSEAAEALGAKDARVAHSLRETGAWIRESAGMLRTVVASDPRAQDEIMAGLRLLDRSLAPPSQVGSAESADYPDVPAMLNEAAKHTVRALVFDPHNAFAHLLTAHCHFNMARYGRPETEMLQYHRCLTLAARNCGSRPVDDPVRLEIEAENALMFERDVASAMEKYERLSTHSTGDGWRFALRAHWMLAGIYLGDWGTASDAPDVIDAEKARQHILAILANWPHSPEAAFYRTQIDMKPDDFYLAIPIRRAGFASWLATSP